MAVVMAGRLKYCRVRTDQPPVGAVHPLFPRHRALLSSTLRG
jgi:hypothetical protein